MLTPGHYLLSKELFPRTEIRNKLNSRNSWKDSSKENITSKSQVGTSGSHLDPRSVISHTFKCNHIDNNLVIYTRDIIDIKGATPWGFYSLGAKNVYKSKQSIFSFTPNSPTTPEADIK